MSLLSKIEWTDATWNPVGAAQRLVPAASIAMPRGSLSVSVASGTSIREGI